MTRPHAGETAPGRDCVRYLCPLCDWFYDESRVAPNLMTGWPRGARDIHDAVRIVADRWHAETEAAIADHLVSAHTAPIVLSTDQG